MIRKRWFHLQLFASFLVWESFTACEAVDKNTTEEKNAIYSDDFFKIQKEVEDFVFSQEPKNKEETDTLSLPNTKDLYIDLDPDILLERDYDFYEDDSFKLGDTQDAATAESANAEVTVKAGFYPASTYSNRRDSTSYDYDYHDEKNGYASSNSYHDYGSESYGDTGGSYGGSYDSGYKVKPKPPGPFGYPTPNFKCEKSSETLYVTKTEWTFDKKCFNVYKVQCTQGYDEGKVMPLK